MAILIDKNTRVMTQGITGKTGQFHTKMGKEYANGKHCYVAGVTPKKGGQSFEGIPIFETVKEAKQATGANVSVIYVPPPLRRRRDRRSGGRGARSRDLHHRRHTGAATWSARATGCRARRRCSIGPNCPGVITPDEIKIGIMPGHIHKQGPVGVVSRSGTLTYEAVGQLTALGLGQSSLRRASAATR